MKESLKRLLKPKEWKKERIRRFAAVFMAAVAVCAIVIVSQIGIARDGRSRTASVTNVLQAAEGEEGLLDDAGLDVAEETLVLDEDEIADADRTEDKAGAEADGAEPSEGGAGEAGLTADEAGQDEDIVLPSESAKQETSAEADAAHAETDGESVVLTEHEVTAEIYTAEDLKRPFPETEGQDLPVITVYGNLPEQAFVAAWPQEPDAGQKKKIGEAATKSMGSYCVMVYTMQDGKRVEWQPQEPVEVAFILPDSMLQNGTVQGWHCDRGNVDRKSPEDEGEKIVFTVDHF